MPLAGAWSTQGKTPDADEALSPKVDPEGA